MAARGIRIIGDALVRVRARMCRNAEAARIAILGQCVVWASSATAARSFVHTRNFLGCAAFVVMALASAAVHSNKKNSRMSLLQNVWY